MFDWLSADVDQIHSAQPVHHESRGVVTQGILAGTRVASNLGWRVIEALAPGDKVLTFDNGMQTIKEVRREVHMIDEPSVPQQHWPINVPVGALSNRIELSMLPDQGVVVESDVADEAMDDPFAVLTARHLVGLRGITQSPARMQQEAVTLVFENEEVIYAEGGALIHCPKPGDLFAHVNTGTGYKLLDEELAALVVDELRLEDALNARQPAFAAA